MGDCEHLNNIVKNSVNSSMRLLLSTAIDQLSILRTVVIPLLSQKPVSKWVFRNFHDLCSKTDIPSICDFKVA